MSKIKFGTDGWRAIIAKDFTVDNVSRAALAISTWLLSKGQNLSVVIGFDCRFGGEMFAKAVAKVLAIKGIHIYLAPEFVSTPMVSYGVVSLETDLGIIITASHNPPEYNGLKIKGSYGGPLFETELKNIENLIHETNEVNIETIQWEDLIDQNIIEYVDLESIYIEYLKSNFNIKLIKESGFKFAFDAMFGSGQRVLRKILPGIKCSHCQKDPFFNGIPPEPVYQNLLDFAEKLKTSWKVDAGLAVDGDADRIAMFDADGNYVDSHHVILLLIHYLAGYKKLKGKIVTGFSSTVKVEKLAAHYGLEVERVEIGFKKIAEVMLKEDVLVGGEESGGISIKGNLPERDGIWMGLSLFQFMAETGKSLRNLIEEVDSITGSFVYQRQDLKMPSDLKNRIIKKCQEDGFSKFGDFEVAHVEDFDGWKFYFNEDEWYMIRPSGTEPLLRTYAEGRTTERVNEILRAGYDTIMHC